MRGNSHVQISQRGAERNSFPRLYLYQQVREYLKHGITLNREDTVFDIGANIGLFSLLVNDLCDGKANILAFEPIPDIFAALSQNAEKFNKSQIKVFPIGLGQKSQTREFAYYPNATALSSMYPWTSQKEKEQFKNTALENFDELPFFLSLIKFFPGQLRLKIIDRLINFALLPQQVNCEIKTVSQVIQEQRVTQIDLLKIDVEKSELEVLQGILSKDWSKIKQIIVEVHNINDRVSQIINLLAEKGFSQIKQNQEPVFKHLDIHSIYARS